MADLDTLFGPIVFCMNRETLKLLLGLIYLINNRRVYRVNNVFWIKNDCILESLLAKSNKTVKRLFVMTSSPLR